MEQTLIIPPRTTTPSRSFLRAWKMNYVLANALGLAVLHPLIAHGFTGPHEVTLTWSEFTMHSVSLLVFLLLLTFFQNKALQHQFNRTIFQDAGFFVLLVPVAFWLGYYTLYIPFDIIFMYLTIGLVNGILLKGYFADPNKWVWQSLLAGAAAALVGTACGFAAFYAYYKELSGVTADMYLWFFISVPASFTYATISQLYLKKQLLPE